MEGQEYVHIDWSTRLNPPPMIRDQENTLACCVFAFTTVTEYKMQITDGKHRDLSPQFLLDWAPITTHEKFPDKLFYTNNDIQQFLVETGIPEEAHYRELDLRRNRSENCQSHCYKVTGFEKLSNDKRKLIEVLDKHGPFVAKIVATEQLRDWEENNGEVFIMNEPTEAEKNRAHAIAVVGYGERFQDGEWLEYFKIQNSWGKSNGKGGYSKICIGKSTRERGRGKYKKLKYKPIKAVSRPLGVDCTLPPDYQCGCRYGCSEPAAV